MKKSKFKLGECLLVNYGRHYNEKEGLTRIGIVEVDGVRIKNSQVLVRFEDVHKVFRLPTYMSESQRRNEDDEYYRS